MRCLAQKNKSGEGDREKITCFFGCSNVNGMLLLFGGLKGGLIGALAGCEIRPTGGALNKKGPIFGPLFV